MKFYSKEDVREFSEQLEKHGIEYRINSEGAIFFKSKDEVRVKPIADEVMHRSNIPTAYEFSDFGKKNHYLSELESRGVVYKESIVDGKFLVLVGKKDSSIANTIYQKRKNRDD